MIKLNTPPVVGKVICAFILAVVIVTATYSSAEASRELVFVNYTGESISSIYLNGHSVGGLSNGQSRSVKLGSGSIFDLSINFSSGRNVHWDDLDLHQIWRITFIRNGSAIRAQWN